MQARDDFEKALSFVSGDPSIARTTIGARLAYATGDTAECGRLARRMYEQGNLHDRRWASRILAQLMLSQNRPAESLKLIRDYIVLDDSVTKIDRANTILKMNALYD